MKHRKIKVLLAVLFFIVTLFFSNDFGLIDIERTAIITALAIDYSSDGEYEVTAQIAVPEATDANTENKRAQITGKGGTVASAIKNIGDLSGWYPNMNFCNLLIIGKEMADSNVMKVLDFFSKTLRLQDSALLVMTDGKAKELLYVSTPFDSISSFALQKIIIKNTGFENDVAIMDIKNFCTGYYSSSSSSYMPIVKMITQSQDTADSSTGSSGSQKIGSAGNMGGGSSGGQGDTLFVADTTALFKNGKKVGELDKELSFIFNLITRDMKDALYELKGVNTGDEELNYLLTINKNDKKIKLIADDNELKLKIDLDVYCKVGDHNAETSKNAPSSNAKLPYSVKQNAEEFFTEKITELIETERQTECDFLNIKQTLYRKKFKYYNRYKDNFLSVMKIDLSVTVNGQE